LRQFQVHLKSPFILNGVCVRWKGYVDLERLDGAGCVEFDDESATLEDAILKVGVFFYAIIKVGVFNYAMHKVCVFIHELHRVGVFINANSKG
jgi:hypothetical protein